MGFVRKAAGAILPFGLIGNALLKKDKKKDKPKESSTTPSLTTANYSSSTPSSLVSRPQIL